MCIAGLLYSLVEVDSVLIEEVTGGEIRASTKPPRICGPVWIHCLKVAVIEVDRRGHGVLGVEHHAQASRVEVEGFDIGVQSLMVYPHLLDGWPGKGAIDHADIHTSFLKNISILENSRDAPAPVFPRPSIHSKLLPVDLL